MRPAMNTIWNSDDHFGFEGPAAGGNLAAAATPAAPAASSLQPQQNAARALVDPKGSAIFWLALFAVLGLAMVSGQLAVSAKVRARGGK
jgi:hypothetical protein